MAAALQRTTRGFMVVAVAATLVTVGAGAYQARQPQTQLPAPQVATQQTQALPRPFGTPSGPPPPGSPPADMPRTELRPGVSLPTTVLDAYRRAEARLGRAIPGCQLSWSLLAAIGQVESAQARGGALTADGTTVNPVIGPALNGKGFAAIPDTDQGRLDGDTRWDRAVGPMQFIPTTWAAWGTDGNDDGTATPHNMYDAALTAGRYLCAGGRDLSDAVALREAILSYNRSKTYANTVLGWIVRFSGQPAPGLAPDPAPSPSPAQGPSNTVSTLPSPDPPPLTEPPVPEDSGSPGPSASPPPDPRGDEVRERPELPPTGAESASGPATG
ncbi:lytic transglycosylase domain-containing protein [Streptomyces sp. 058-1L]|uniref:lytic transglycosylase domain-containing protein n=1 Tax=Streptomyces sp. 058-1L TaxID=2789266 RepID=UPI0039801C85